MKYCLRFTTLQLAITFGLLLGSLSSLQADNSDLLKMVDRSIRLRQYALAADQLQPLLKQKNAQAQYRMAGLYRSGKGVKKDARKALDYYRLAAVNGLADAQYALASLLEKQGSAEQKKTEVQKWYQAAAAQGQRKAKLKLDRLKKQVSNTEPVNIEGIFSAVRINDLEQIKRLIEQHVDLNFLDNKRRSPFMVALLSEQPGMAELLLPHTRQPDIPDINQDRPLHIAANKGYRSIVERLLKRGADINAQDRLGNSALILATRHDDAAIISLLLDKRADPMIRNRKNLTAPRIAQTLGLDNARRLFQKYHIALPPKNKEYAEVDIKAFKKTVAQSNSIYQGWPLINIASLLGETAIVAQLLNQGSNINARDKAGNTALHRAASKGQMDTIKLLVNHGIQINAVNNKNESALFSASRQGKLKAVKYLISQRADSAIISQNNNSALSIAIINQHQATANFLSIRKLDKPYIHQSLLQAIQHNMENVAINLAKRDNRLLFSDEKERTVLWKSVDKGFYNTTKALLETGKIPLNKRDKEGYTELARAAYRGHDKIFELLLKYGANVQTLTQENNTILMLSIVSGNNRLIRQAISLNIDFNQQNNAGDTALMLAAGKGNLKAVKWLIEIPVDIQVRNRHDQNAYQIALAAGHQKIADYIREKSGHLFKIFN